MTEKLKDRYIRCPENLQFVVKNLIEDDSPMKNPDGQPFIYTWRQMIMTAVMSDPRLMKEGPLQLDHIEKAELIAVARAAPGEPVRVSGRTLECLQKVILTSPAFDVSTNGIVMHGYIAQQPEVQAWFSILLDAPTTCPDEIKKSG